MELIIDAQRCDLPLEKIHIPPYDCSRFADPNAARSGRSLQLVVPATSTNDQLFGRGRDPETGIRFNEVVHAAVLTHEGAVLMQGSVRLLASSAKGYTIELREGGERWASEAAQRKLSELDLLYMATLSPTTVVESWEEGGFVKFLPIHRDSYPAQSQPADLLPAERLLSVDDYHPFLQIDRLVRQIFADAGYTVQSDFMQSDFFRSLYMSGAYAHRDTTALKSRMGFLAGRLTSASAAANYLGRVYASPYSAAYSLGNIVESASPAALNEAGEPCYTLYNNGQCFKLEADGAISFTPTTAVTVGFEYDLHYTTEHRITSRHYLTGFDSVYLGAGSDLKFRLANRYTDRRNNLSNNYTYRAIVFDHTEGNTYRLRSEIDGVATTWKLLSERAELVTSPASGELQNPTLDYLQGGYWVPYEGDWALYDGYIEERGETAVHLRVSTASREVAAGQTVRFDQLYFYGAEEGMRLTLHRETTLTPRFYAGGGFGSTLFLADILQHGMRQIELLQALAHLFNLRFYTDEASKTVRIEPYDTFYRDGVVDWREKVDLGEPIQLIDTAVEQHELRRWCYLASDGVVKRWEEQQGEEFGAWSYTTPSAATLQGEACRRNPLFAASFSAAGHYRNAPSALLLEVGDRDATEGESEPLTPRIVSLIGMHSLPEGEHWGYPATENRYPLAAFHFAGDGDCAPRTLCFEDRDGVEGLHRFYDRQLLHESLCGAVELTLRLAPSDYESLLLVENGGADLRTRYLLRTDEGELLGTLNKVGHYDPTTGEVRCRFNRCDER